MKKLRVSKIMLILGIVAAICCISNISNAGNINDIIHDISQVSTTSTPEPIQSASEPTQSISAPAPENKADTSLPNTGVDDTIMWVLIGVSIVAAGYTYKKVRDYTV